MSDLLLPFALRTADGKFVSPEEVPRGLACKCVCPGCAHPVQARHGTERVWHFAHAKASDCAGAYEKSVHEAAKQMLRDRPELFLPALTITTQAVDAFNRLAQESETLFEAKHVIFESCKPGQVVDDVSPDLVGTVRGRRLIIEVTVFHRLMPEKLERLQQTGLAVLELDLREFKNRQATREGLEAALFNRKDNRRWAWHPARAAVEPRLKEALRQRLAEREAEWAQQQQPSAQSRWDALYSKIDALRSPPPPRHSTVFHDVGWRAGFPAEEIMVPARAAFCERHGIPREQVDAVFGAMIKRSELARTTPTDLAQAWAEQLGVTENDIIRYFREGGYVL